VKTGRHGDYKPAPILQMQYKIKKYILRLFALLFMLPAAVLGCLWLVISLPFTQRYILDIAEHQVERVLTGECSIHSFTTNFVSYVRVDNIVLRDSSGHGDSIAVHSVRAHFSLLPFLHKKVFIKKATIDRLDAFLTVAPSGKLMIPALPDSMFLEYIKHRKKKKKHPPEWQLYIGSGRVNKLNATYSDSQHTFIGTIKNSVAAAEIYRVDSMNLHLAVRDGSYESPWWTGKIDTVGGMSVLTLKGMTIDSFYLGGSSTRVTGDGKIPFSDTGLWHFAAEVNSDVKPIKAIFGYVPSLLTDNGTVHAVASWDGTLKHPVLKAQATGKSWKSTQFDIPSLYADGSYDGDSLLSFGLAAITGLGKVTCSTNVHTELLFVKPVFKEYQSGLNIHDLGLKEIALPEYINKYLLWENGKAAVKVSGCGFTSFPDTISANVVLGGAPYGVDSISSDVSLIRNRWNLAALFGKNRITADGDLINDTTVRGRGHAALYDPGMISKLFSNETAGGSLSADVRVNGNVINPDFSLQIRSNTLSWRTVSCDSMMIDLEKRGKKYHFDSSYVSLNARLDSISTFLKTTDFGGTCLIGATFNGNMTSPDVRADMKIVDAVYSSYSADSVKGLLYAGRLDSIHIDSIQVFKSHAGFECRGDVVLSKKQIAIRMQPLKYRTGTWIDTGVVDIRGGIQGDSLDFIAYGKSIDLSLLNGWIPGDDSIQGIVDIAGHIGSEIKNPQGYLKLFIHHPSYNKIDLKSVDAQFELADSLITGDAIVSLDHNNPDSVVCNLSIPLTKNDSWAIKTSSARPLRVRMNADHIDLGSLMTSVLDSNWHADGSVNCSVEIQDSGKGFGVEGKLNIDAGRVDNDIEKISGRSIHATANVTGSVNCPNVNYYFTTGIVEFPNGIIDSTFFIGHVTSDSIHCEIARISLPHEGLLSLSGVIPVIRTDSLLLQPGLKIDFVIVKFPLRLVADFFPENMIKSGVAQGKGHIEVRNGRPLFNGYLNVDTVVIAPEDISPEIGPLSIRIVLKDDSIHVQQFNGKWGRGKINGRGYAVWDYNGLDDLKLNVKGKNIDGEIVDIMEADIPEFDLSILKQNKKFLIKGEVDVGASRFYRDIRIADFFQDKNSAEFKKERTDTLLKNMELQVKLNMLEDLIVDMNLGYFEIGSNITITGDLQNPSYIGEVTINDGSVIYLDRKFDVTEGSFRNYEPDQLNPSLNLKAETEVFGAAGGGGAENTETYTIYMDLSGTLKNPVLKFSEEGGKMNDADIISILTFGQPLGSIGGDLGERLRAFAGQSILGFGTRKLEQALRLDRIDIQGDIFKLGQNNNSSKNAPTLTLSKRISPSLLLTYETVLGDLTRRRVSALFRLTRRLFIKGNADNNDYGLDFIFKYSK
jgi:hypothetical protein